MLGKPRTAAAANRPKGRAQVVFWLSGVWILPLLGFAFWLYPTSASVRITIAIATALLAPIPALLIGRRQRSQLLAATANAKEEAEQLKLQLDTVRYRT